MNMRFKDLTFILLCCLGLFFLSCSQPQEQSQKTTENPVLNKEHQCIENVLAKDNELGEKRNHDCETIPLDATIIKYADGIDKIDFKNCPPAFTLAFENHRQAWLAMVPLVKKFPDLRGEMHDLFDIIEKSNEADTFKPLLKAIWDTWGEVDEAMKGTGVNLKSGE